MAYATLLRLKALRQPMPLALRPLLLLSLVCAEVIGGTVPSAAP
jgi:hypothetical protein